MDKKVKILIVSLNAWDDSNSFGSSFSNIFGGEDRYEIANIFCENGAPNSDVCSYFFQITEKSIIKSILNKSIPSGRRVLMSGEDRSKHAEKPSKHESKMLNIAKRLRWQILFWARDLVWATKRWKSPQLESFITDFDPDIIFQPIFFSSYVNEIGIYAKRLTSKTMLGYISDDNYTYKQFSLSPLFWIDRAIKRRYVKRAIDSCITLYTITERQKREYNSIFGEKCKVLFKGGEFANSEDRRVQLNAPLKIAYTGNLASGRWESLVYLAKALHKINENGAKAQLFIYSATALSNSVIRQLNIDNSSFFCGRVSSDEVRAIQKDADILVHVESFKLSERYSARLSFSTKIVDYFEAGRCILAIGWGETGAIEYLRDSNAAVVVSDRGLLFEKVSELVENHNLINEYADRGFNFGRDNHQIAQIRATLYSDIICIQGCDRSTLD